MSEQLWVVRAGRGARYADEFQAGSYIAIGFDELASDDLSNLGEDALRARATSPAERVNAGQLSALAYRMQVGDLVIVPRLTTTHRDYLVAQVTGPYQYVTPKPSSGRHRRAVRWLGRFSRESLSQSAINTLGAISTIFRPTAVEPELRDLLTALLPLDIGAASTPAVPGNSPIGPGASRSARHGRGSSTGAAAGGGAARHPSRRRGTSSNHMPSPRLVMEQTPRHVDPQTEWDGVPGIYVLTGTTLQQSSSRTGNERTLTTTLIVRPWAYVGLSEDFRGRLSSHRQSKPEWRRALLVRSGAQPFSSDDIKYLEQQVHAVLRDTGEVLMEQATPRGNLSAHPAGRTCLTPAPTPSWRYYGSRGLSSRAL